MVARSQDLPFITKIMPPRRRHDLTLRPRLLSGLQSGLDRRVQLLWAPAGYGKTSALGELAVRVDFPVSWYRLTPEDREPAAFVGYCVRAVELAIGTSLDGTGAPYRPPSRQPWRTALGEFVTLLQGRVPGRMLFIFDDVHHLDSCPEVREALSLFVERAPEGVHFILSGRSRPSLPCLPRLTVQDEVSIHDVQSLRFSPAETSALLSARWRRPVEEWEAKAITKRTAGWPTGIDLLSKAGESLEAVAGADTTEDLPLFGYLTEEVFRKLPALQQDFLLRTSVLNEFTAELCDELLDRKDSEAILRDLREGGLFIEERFATVPVYRYHDIFHDYLERAFRNAEPDAYLTLHRKAAALAAAQGDEGSAILHLASAGETGEAGRLLARIAEPYFQRGRWQTLQTWLSLLPSDLVESDPQLALVQAKVHLRLGQPVVALQWLDRIIAGPISSQEPILGRALVAKSFGRRMLGNLEAAADEAKRGLVALRAANAPDQDVAEAYRQLASALGTRGEFAEARRNFELALTLAPDEDLQLRSLIHDGLAATSVEMGHLDIAAVHLEKARQGWLKLGNEGSLAESLNNLAFVYYYRGEFDIALDELKEAARAAAASGAQRLMAAIKISQGVAYRALRDYRSALDCFLFGLAEARHVLDHRLVAEATNGLGGTYRRLGEPDKAQTLLKQAIIEAEQSGQSYSLARYHIALGKTFAQVGNLNGALDSLRLGERLFQERGSVRGAAEAKLHEGAVLYRLGRIDEARTAMGDLAGMLDGLGYEGFLVADGDEALDVLRLSAARGIGKQRFASLLRRLEGRPEQDDARAASPAANALPVLKVFGFGEGQVFLERHPITDPEWRSRKAKELFYFLIRQRGVVSKEQIIDALWPEGTEGDYEDALRTAMYRLRKAIYQDFVLSVGDGYCINPDAPIEFDLTQFEDLIRKAEGCQKGSPDRVALLARSVALYRGPFLGDFYSEWCEAVRRILNRKHHHALLELSTYHATLGELPQAIELAGRILIADPYDEAAYLILAKCYLQSRDPLSALRRMRDYMTIAREELQASPSAQFMALYQQALREGPFTPTTPNP